MKFFRKTKIIATFGPAIKDEKIFAQVIKAGVNVIRFNFSHLTPESAQEQIQWVKQQLKKMQHDVAFLGDLKGPEIRTDLETYSLSTGEEIYFCHLKEKAGLLKKQSPKKSFKKSLQVVGIDHPCFYSLVKEGQKVLADDGNFEFTVMEVEGRATRLRVNQGGLLKTKKSVIVPGVDVGLPILNQKDRANLKMIVKHKFGWIAASFVSSAKDVEEIRQYVKKCGGDIPIISKIESRKGVKNIDEILNVTNGVMVARGDLGLEYPFEEVPILQEIIINKAKARGVVTIIATQMLDSMTDNPRPSRPEVSDISYATRSRVDAVMLSGETASGKHPRKAVVAMDRIVSTSERYYQSHEITPYSNPYRLVPFCEMAIKLAFKVGTRRLIAISSQGKSVRYLSAFRPDLVNIVATKNRELYYRCRLYHSVYPIMMNEKLTDKSELFADVIQQCKGMHYLKRGDKFIHIFTHQTHRVSKKFELPTNSIREEIVE